MKKRLGDLWESIKLFWFSHKVDFYFGMVLSVLVMLNLVTFATFTTSLLVCPVVTPLVYFSLWLIAYPQNTIGSKFVGEGVLASELGCAWALLLTIL